MSQQAIETIKQPSKENITVKCLIPPKALAFSYIVLVIAGVALSYYANNHSALHDHRLRTVAIIVIFCGWLAAIMMTRTQNYRYLLSSMAFLLLPSLLATTDDNR